MKVKNKLLNYINCLSIRYKLMSVYIIITVTTLAIYSACSYSFIRNELLLKYQSIVNSNAELIKNKINNWVNTTNNFAKIIACEDTVQELLINGKFYEPRELEEKKRKIKFYLNQIVNVNDFISVIQISDQFNNKYSSYLESQGNAFDIYKFSIPTGPKDEFHTRFEISLNTVISYHYFGKVVVFHYNIYDMYDGRKIGELNFIIDTIDFSNYLNQYCQSSKDIISIVDLSNNLVASTQIDTENIKIQEMNKYTTRIDTYWSLVQHISMDYIQSEIKRLLIRLLLLTILFIFFTGVVIALVSTYLIKPILLLRQGMKSLSKGNFNAIVYVKNKDEIGDLVDSYNYMLSDINHLMNEVISEQKEKRKYEYMVMQTQINPHFLYNTLETICGLADTGEKDKITYIVGSLSSFYRNILGNGRNIITLKEEIEISKNYMNILGVRYENLFTYEINIDQNLLDCQCLKLIIQPLIENSIKHGFKNMNRIGHIVIEGRKKENKLILNVADNGCGMSEEDFNIVLFENKGYESKGFALYNIENRIHLYFGEDYGLSISNNNGCGTVVTICLPCVEKGQEVF